MFILSNLVQANRDLATAYVHLVTRESNQGYDYTALSNSRLVDCKIVKIFPIVLKYEESKNTNLRFSLTVNVVLSLSLIHI